jgi:arylformamidase
MKLIDVSVKLSPETPTFPGNPTFACDPVKRTALGDSANVTALHLGTHTGTHVDAPRHFFDSARGVDALPLDVLMGPAQVVEIGGPRRGIEADDLASLDLAGETRVLLKTGTWQYEMYCLPLDIAGADGAPARVVLRELTRESRSL